MFQCMYAFIYLCRACRPMFACMFVVYRHLFMYEYVCMQLYIRYIQGPILRVCLSVCLSLCLCLVLSICLCLCPSVSVSLSAIHIYTLSLCTRFSSFVFLCVSLCHTIYIGLYVSVSIYFWISVCLSVCMSVYLFVSASSLR